MKRNENYVVKELMGEFVLVPIGEAAIDFNGVITLNETAKFMWEKAEGNFTSEDLEKALIEKYEIDSETAKKAAESFINSLKEEGCIE
jgi:hypothetical protein